MSDHTITKERSDAIRSYVRTYLTDCYANRAILREQYHPTITGCLKVVYHTKAEETAVRDAYHQETSSGEDT